MKKKKSQNTNTHLPAHPDENGDIDCLHPKAEHKNYMIDKYYNEDVNDEELAALIEKIPKGKDQKLHYKMRAIVRYMKNNYQKCIVGMTSHYFICLVPTRDPQSTEKWELLCRIHVMEIKKMFFGSNFQSVVFFAIRLNSFWVDNKKIKSTIYIESNYSLKFSRICIRNFCLAFSAAYGLGQEIPDGLHLRPETSRPDLFPTFDAVLSPSEQFQFTYFAICSNDNQKYVHDVVRYFHHQVVTLNGIFNVGHLPFRFTPREDITNSELIPIFRALLYIPYMFGIVCSRFLRPDVIYAISFQLYLSKSIHFLYCSDCGATSGLQQIARNLMNNPLCPLQYIDFSRNVFTDFPGFFPNVFKNRPSPIWYLNFSYCGMSTAIVQELFDSLTAYEVCWGVKYIHIAAAELMPPAVSSYINFLRTVTEKKKQSLISLNLSDTRPAIIQMLQPLKDFPMPLRELFIANCKVDHECYKVLCRVLKCTPTLATLDVSNTGISAEQLANITYIMSDRPGLHQLTLIANKLNLNGKNLISVVKGFLNGDVTRWRKISMDSNLMRVPDIQILTSLFNRMPNLRELSLSDNFDSSMAGIEAELPDILRIRNLEVLHIAGGKSHSLGKKIFPFLFAVGLSYAVRMYIGDYPAREDIPDLNDIKYNAMTLLENFFQSSLVPDEANRDIDELGERFGDLIIPYLVRKSVTLAKKDLKDHPEGRIKLVEQIMPLLSVIAERLTIKNESEQISHFIGHKVVSMLQLAHNKFGDSTLKNDLSERMDSLIKHCARLCALKELDIRHNKIGDWGVNVVIELLKLDDELLSVDIDGSHVTTISLVTSFVSECINLNNLTRQQFPVNDAKRIVRTAKAPARRIAETELVKEQMRLVRAIDKHRAMVGEHAELPFDLVPELKDLIDELSGKIGFYLKPDRIRNHSGVVEEFGLQLPYLEADTLGNKLPDNYKKVEIGEQEWYEAPSMKKRFIETDEDEDLYFVNYAHLARRQIEDGNTDVTDITAGQTDIEDDQSERIDPEEKPEFVPPIEIRRIMEDTREIIRVDDEPDDTDKVIETGLLDFNEEEILAVQDTNALKGEAEEEISLDDDDDGMPLFYEGDSDQEKKKKTTKTKKSKKKKFKALSLKSGFTLTKSELEFKIQRSELNIAPPED